LWSCYPLPIKPGENPSFADELPFKASIYKDANLPFLITEG
jgi:hypothetical protein